MGRAGPAASIRMRDLTARPAQALSIRVKDVGSGPAQGWQAYPIWQTLTLNRNTSSAFLKILAPTLCSSLVPSNGANMLLDAGTGGNCK